MVVEQEMAEIYPPAPEDLSEYFPETDCGKCGFESCLAFAEAVLGAQQSARSCPEIDEELAQLVDRMVGLKKEPIPYNIMMEQAPCELICCPPTRTAIRWITRCPSVCSRPSRSGRPYKTTPCLKRWPGTG